TRSTLFPYTTLFRSVYAGPAPAGGAAGPGLRHPGPRPGRRRQARPAPRRKLRWRAAGDRADERELWPGAARRWNGAVHAAAGGPERLCSPRPGPRYPAGPDTWRRSLPGGPEQRSPPDLPLDRGEAGASDAWS